MKRVLIAIAIAVLILAFTASAALAQGGPSRQPFGCCGGICQDLGIKPKVRSHPEESE